MSKPIPRAISSTSAPTFSQRSAISFIKIILIANIELLAYLISSDDRLVVKIIGKLLSKCFLYIEFKVDIEFLFFVPKIILSGFSKSKIAEPSLKNSGFETTSKSMDGFTKLIISSTLSHVPTGTVDFKITTVLLFIFFPIASAHAKTWDKSAPSFSIFVGVPTAIKIASAFFIV